MFKWLKDKWLYLIRLGVSESMSISLQKKVILSNQLAFLFFVVFILMTTVSLFFAEFDIGILYSYLSILLLLFVPFLNSKGKYHISAFLISVLTPFFSYIFGTIVTTDNVTFNMYIVPRIFMISMLSIPFIVIDKTKKILIVISIAFILFLLFSLDYYLKLKGFAFDEKNIDFIPYRTINYYVGFAAFVLLFGLFFLTNINAKYEDKILLLVDELKNANIELEQQKMTIQNAFEIIDNKNHKITDSIEYAKKIQTAFLPANSFFQKILPDSFILFLPRDIVSGDFFWITENENKKIIVAADCTGHGVPGAFLSVLGLTLLNNIVISRNIIQPDIILNELRKNVKISLGQFDDFSEQKDGMDISVCVLENKTLQFSGAYNSVYVVRNNELIVLKADRQPVGLHIIEKDFTLRTLNLLTDDVIYMFSDGYISQFGGENNDKLSSKRFKNLILEIHQEKINLQQKLLLDFFENWKGYKNEQVDDVLVIGIKI